MFKPIEEYILLSRDKRRSHLRLDQKCITIGGHSSTVFKGLLAHFLKTTIPTRQKIYLCHACNNPNCSNPVHLYWGTGKDNCQDAQECGTRSKNIKLLSENELKNLRSMLESEPRTWGWIGRLAIKMNCSSKQITRYLKFFNMELSRERRNFK